MADKQIKIALVVDERSADQAKRALTQLVNVAKELGKALGGTGGPGGGGGGGLLGGLNVAGGGPGGAPVKIGAPGGQNVFATMAKDNQTVLKNLKGATVDTMKSMADSVRRAIEDERKQLESLKKENQALNSEYEKRAKLVDRLAQKGGKWAHTLGSDREALSGLGGKVMGNQQSQNEAAERLDRLTNTLEELNSSLNPSSPKSGGLMAALTQQRHMPGSGAIGNSPWARMMGISPGMVGSMGLATAGMIGLRGIGREIDQQPLRQVGFNATMGGIAGQRIMPLSTGDLRDGMSMRDIYSDPNMGSDYNNLQGGGRRFLKGAGGFFKSLVTADFHGMGNALTGRTADIAIAQEQQQFRDQNRQRDMLGDSVRGEMTGGFRSRLSLMRALGIGAGAKHGHLGYSALNRYRSNYAGFDEGEIASAKMGIEGTGTRSAGFSLLGNVLQAQAAGIQGAAGMGGTMSKFGIGTGNNFVRALRSAVGGGMDVSTASTLGGFVSSQMDGLGYQGLTGMGMLGMLSSGANGPNGRLIAEQNMRGAGALNSTFMGQTDPYQSARNLQIAIGAAPNVGIYGQDYLANRVGIGEMSEMAAGGKLSPIAKALGLNSGMFGETMRGKTSSLFERMIVDPNAANTPMGKQLKSMMDSGLDPQSWFKKNRAGAKNKGSFDESSTANYAAAIMMSNPGMDQATALGEARDIFGLGSKASTKGRLAGDVAGGTVEIKQAVEEMNTLAEKTKIATGELSQFGQELAIQTFRLRKERELSMGDKTGVDRDLSEQALLGMGKYMNGKRSPDDAYNMMYGELVKAKNAPNEAAIRAKKKEGSTAANYRGR